MTRGCRASIRTVKAATTGGVFGRRCRRCCVASKGRAHIIDTEAGTVEAERVLLVSREGDGGGGGLNANTRGRPMTKTQMGSDETGKRRHGSDNLESRSRIVLTSEVGQNLGQNCVTCSGFESTSGTDGIEGARARTRHLRTWGAGGFKAGEGSTTDLPTNNGSGSQRTFLPYAEQYLLWHSGEPVSPGCLCHFSTSSLLSSFFFCGLLTRVQRKGGRGDMNTRRRREQCPLLGVV